MAKTPHQAYQTTPLDTFRPSPWCFGGRRCWGGQMEGLCGSQSPTTSKRGTKRSPNASFCFQCSRSESVSSVPIFLVNNMRFATLPLLVTLLHREVAPPPAAHSPPPFLLPPPLLPRVRIPPPRRRQEYVVAGRRGGRRGGVAVDESMFPHHRTSSPSSS